MHHYRSIQETNVEASWITIGAFDGVHQGHQVLLQQLADKAHQQGFKAGVITFYPHPSVVLRSIEHPFYLTDPDERAERMGTLGIDFVITLAFDRQMAVLSAAEFIQPLVQTLGMKKLWAGPDFALGRNREGSLDKLAGLGKQWGYSIQLVEPQLIDGQKISSTLIRQQLQAGDVVAAAAQLGRLYSVKGKIVHGEGRGSGLGIPTANFEVWKERLLPAVGVYATWVWIGDRRIPSVTNLGRRPTFEFTPDNLRLEAHLLENPGDLYGEELTLEFAGFLRNETKFDSLDELIRQIEKDIKTAREVYLHAP